MDNRGKGKGESFIIYLNDDGSQVSAYVQIIEISVFVTFKTGNNTISIPASRVLKIKERNDEF